MQTALGSWNRSKLVVPLVVIIVIAASSTYLLFQQAKSPESLTSTRQISSSTSDVQPSEPVRAAVNHWIQDFNNRDVTSLMNFYDFSADVVWDGNTQGLQGAYAGSGSIKILYGSTIGKTTELKATIDNYSEKIFSPTHVNVTLELELKGNSTTLGFFNGTIHAVQEWFYSSGQWVVVQEHWSYRTLQVQFPASSTTFPQWSALRIGRSPDLVSEKSLEWSAGPIIAGATYAFLAFIVLVAVKKHTKTTRSKI